jgi:hypothetical protein
MARDHVLDAPVAGRAGHDDDGATTLGEHGPRLLKVAVDGRLVEMLQHHGGDDEVNRGR